MESILIYPENAEQLKTVKAVLKALKVQFESQSDRLPPHVLNGIEKSMEQYENGQQFLWKNLKINTLLKNELYNKVHTRSRENL